MEKKKTPTHPYVAHDQMIKFVEDEQSWEREKTQREGDIWLYT